MFMSHLLCPILLLVSILCPLIAPTRRLLCLSDHIYLGLSPIFVLQITKGVDHNAPSHTMLSRFSLRRKVRLFPVEPARFRVDVEILVGKTLTASSISQVECCSRTSRELDFIWNGWEWEGYSVEHCTKVQWRAKLFRAMKSILVQFNWGIVQLYTVKCMHEMLMVDLGGSDGWNTPFDWFTS